MKTNKDPRHQARRLAVSIVFSKELNNSAIENPLETDELINTSIEALEIEKYDADLLLNILNGVSGNYSELKDEIKKNSLEWEIGKIFKIDLSILLIAIWEIKNNNTPVKVIIDEAVELAKEFGETESPKFVNGILAGVVKNL